MLLDVDAVLFDLDGTLIDCSEAICLCFNAALTRYDLKTLPTSTIKNMIGRPLRDLFREQAGNMPVEPFIEEYKRAFAELAPGRSFLLPGARELLLTLSQNKKLGIVTSRSSAGASKILGNFGLRACFSIIVGVEDVEDTKPSPAPVLFALRRIAVSPANAVFVGDTTYDMEAGSRAGTRTIGVTTGPHNRNQLLAAGADLVISGLSGLEKLVRKAPP